MIPCMLGQRHVRDGCRGGGTGGGPTDARTFGSELNKSSAPPETEPQCSIRRSCRHTEEGDSKESQVGEK